MIKKVGKETKLGHNIKREGGKLRKGSARKTFGKEDEKLAQTRAKKHLAAILTHGGFLETTEDPFVF